MTEARERDYYEEAKELLRKQALQLPPDAPADERAVFYHPAVIQHITGMLMFPGLVPSMSFRLLVRVWEDDQKAERERPRLPTLNPPQSWRNKSDKQQITGYVVALFTLIAMIVTVGVGILEPKSAWVPLIFVVALGALSINRFIMSHKSKQKWDTTYRTIVYKPALKSGKDAVVEVQLELPAGWSDDETVSKLENSAKASLYDLFSGLDTVPLRSEVFDCIERAMVTKQRELGIGICRMEILKNVDPAMPPFGKKHIFASNGTIVTYEIADLWRTDAVDAKLREILASRPNTELLRFAKSLNIRFIDIETKPERNATKGFASFNG